MCMDANLFPSDDHKAAMDAIADRRSSGFDTGLVGGGLYLGVEVFVGPVAAWE